MLVAVLFLPYQLSIAKRLVKIVLVEMFCNLTKRVSLKRLKLIKNKSEEKSMATAVIPGLPFFSRAINKHF